MNMFFKLLMLCSCCLYAPPEADFSDTPTLVEKPHETDEQRKSRLNKADAARRQAERDKRDAQLKMAHELGRKEGARILEKDWNIDKGVRLTKGSSNPDAVPSRLVEKENILKLFNQKPDELNLSQIYPELKKYLDQGGDPQIKNKYDKTLITVLLDQFNGITKSTIDSDATFLAAKSKIETISKLIDVLLKNKAQPTKDDMDRVLDLYKDFQSNPRSLLIKDAHAKTQQAMIESALAKLVYRLEGASKKVLTSEHRARIKDIAKQHSKSFAQRIRSWFEPS